VTNHQPIFTKLTTTERQNRRSRSAADFMRVFAIFDRRLGGNYYQFYFLFTTKSTTGSTSEVLLKKSKKYYQ